MIEKSRRAGESTTLLPWSIPKFPLDRFGLLMEAVSEGADPDG